MTCEKHSINKDHCPYCEVDSLKEEIQHYADQGLWIPEKQVEMDRLKAELAEARQEVELLDLTIAQLQNGDAYRALEAECERLRKENSLVRHASIACRDEAFERVVKERDNLQSQLSDYESAVRVDVELGDVGQILQVSDEEAWSAMWQQHKGQPVTVLVMKGGRG